MGNQYTENFGVIPYINIWEMLCPQYFYSTFTTNDKWQVVTGYYWREKKSNFRGKFKWELIITYQLWFIVKVLCFFRRS